MNHTRRSNDWDRAGEIEDCMALLMGLENLRGQIEHKALFEQGYDEIYDLSVKMVYDLRQLKIALKRVRDIVVEIAQRKETKHV